MSWRRALRSCAAALCIAALAAPAGQTAPTPAAAAAPRTSPLQVRIGQTSEFTRLEFHWAGGARATSRREGQDLIVRFSRDADPDIARLRVGPPRWLKTAEKRHVGGALELVLTLTDDADAAMGAADGITYVNLFERAAPPPAAEAAPAASPEPARPNPVPAGGVVRMEAKVVDGQVQLSFPWANPSGAAVFRRGDSVWMVFDAAAEIDVSAAPRGLRQLGAVKAFRGPDYAAVRIVSPSSVPVAALGQGPVWTLALGLGEQPRPRLVKIRRAEAGRPAALTAEVAGVTRIVQVPDPVVGDVLQVVTALGPSKGLPSRRDYVQFAFLASPQGLAVETYASDVAVTHERDLVSVGRPKGLALSPQGAGGELAEAFSGVPQPASMPALIDYENWPKTGSGGFLSRYNALLDAVAEETAQGKEAGVSARMALARFLVGSELAFEAIGVLNEAARRQPSIMNEAEFRGLRGVARVMARRYAEAGLDFSAPVLADDPSSAMWRSYIAARQGHWSDTRREFAAGARAFAHFSPVWKARFARADAEAALAQGDFVRAGARINLAHMEEIPPLEQLETRLVQARLFQAQGHTRRALAVFEAISRAPVEHVAAPATLRATQIRLDEGLIKPNEAVEVFHELRYRWRGDSTELETVRALGHLYLAQGRYREALEVLRSTGGRSPNLPEAVQLQADLSAAFRNLFLEGAADGLEPVQALALFYDFRELTPIGADGDMMVRRLVRRLVDVDLLAPAAELLRYQAENRLDGVARAQVATDLALIYLMDRKPEEALQAIAASRTTVLPTAMAAERRRIEARAWMLLGRHENALEILERDTTAEARELRAEITWRQKDWAKAGPIFEQSLGDRWKAPGPLAADEEAKLLRAGVAYSLAKDAAALQRLHERYAGFYEGARNPEALRVALTGVGGDPMRVSEFSRATADNEAFAGWLAQMKKRFQEPAPARAPDKPTAA